MQSDYKESIAFNFTYYAYWILSDSPLSYTGALINYTFCFRFFPGLGPEIVFCASFFILGFEIIFKDLISYGR